MTQEEYFRSRKNWWISLNKSGKIGPVRDRSDFNDALTTLNRLHQESGEKTTQASAILEIPAMAPIIEFFLQLVAMERFLVELMTESPRLSLRAKSDMIERGDPLWVPSFHKTSDVSTFKMFLRFVAVRSFTADSSLLQPTGGVNTTPHTVHFSQWNTCVHTHGSSLGPHSFHHIHASRACVIWCVCLIALSSTTPFTSSFSPSSLWSPCSSFCPSTSSSRMWRTNTLCTPANEDLGTLAEYDPPTGYEPNEYHITEATEHFTPGILSGAAVPEWLRLRWCHHRQGTLWRMPKTSQSIWRRRPVVLSVVVCQSW